MRRLTHIASIVAALCTLALGAASAQDKSDWPSSMTIGTASQGGTYFIYGAGVANVISEQVGVNTSSEVTGGPVQNATLVQTGDHQLGMVTMGPAYEAWIGESELAPGVEHTDLRAIFPMYQTPFQVIALKGSGIASVADLDGKTVGVGPAGGTPGTYWPRFFEALGLDVRVQYGGAADQAGQMKDGLIDAFAFAAGVPISAFSQLAAEADAVMFGFTEDERKVILDKFPSVSAFTIPTGTYAGHDYDQETVAMWNFAIAHKDLPETLVYEIVKAVMESPDRMVQVHATAKETLPENVDKNTFLPWHPGAVKWFEENGHTIPDDLKG